LVINRVIETNATALMLRSVIPLQAIQHHR
jgi:hypothetical protein